MRSNRCSSLSYLLTYDWLVSQSGRQTCPQSRSPQIVLALRTAAGLRMKAMARLRLPPQESNPDAEQARLQGSGAPLPSGNARVTPPTLEKKAPKKVSKKPAAKRAAKKTAAGNQAAKKASTKKTTDAKKSGKKASATKKSARKGPAKKSPTKTMRNSE